LKLQEIYFFNLFGVEMIGKSNFPSFQPLFCEKKKDSGEHDLGDNGNYTNTPTNAQTHKKTPHKRTNNLAQKRFVRGG
jgi:hypothetical protein